MAGANTTLVPTATGRHRYGSVLESPHDSQLESLGFLGGRAGPKTLASAMTTWMSSCRSRRVLRSQNNTVQPGGGSAPMLRQRDPNVVGSKVFRGRARSCKVQRTRGRSVAGCGRDPVGCWMRMGLWAWWRWREDDRWQTSRMPSTKEWRMPKPECRQWGLPQRFRHLLFGLRHSFVLGYFGFRHSCGMTA